MSDERVYDTISISISMLQAPHSSSGLTFLSFVCLFAYGLGTGAVQNLGTRMTRDGSFLLLLWCCGLVDVLNRQH